MTEKRIFWADGKKTLYDHCLIGKDIFFLVLSVFMDFLLILNHDCVLV